MAGEPILLTVEDEPGSLGAIEGGRRHRSIERASGAGQGFSAVPFTRQCGSQV